MSKSTTKAAAAKKPAKATTKAKVSRVHAGGGIMVDVIDRKAEPTAKATPLTAYREGGAYWAVVNACHKLGANKSHPLDKVIAEIKRQMGAGFKAYAAKKGKLDADERLTVACAVTARSDYGKPLRDTGWETRYDGRAKEIGLFKLGK